MIITVIISIWLSSRSYIITWLDLRFSHHLIFQISFISSFWISCDVFSLFFWRQTAIYNDNVRSNIAWWITPTRSPLINVVTVMEINGNKLVNIVISERFEPTLKRCSCALGNIQSSHMLSETNIKPVGLKFGASFQLANTNITINLLG